MKALYKGLIAAGALSAVAFYPITKNIYYRHRPLALNIYFASLIGLAVTGLLVVITEYYTSTAFAPSS